MSTDLFLTTYRQRERELEQRLERARVARERAAATPALRTTASTRGVMKRLAAWVARGHAAAREAAAPTACCNPA